jgi:hypothetical protein
MVILYAKNHSFVHNLHLCISFLRVRKKQILFLRTTLNIWSLYRIGSEVLCIVCLDFGRERVK